jgi:hypothetical protein
MKNPHYSTINENLHYWREEDLLWYTDERDVCQVAVGQCKQHDDENIVEIWVHDNW